MCRGSEAVERLADSEEVVCVTHEWFEKPLVCLVQYISINEVVKRKRYFQFCGCGIAIILGPV